MDGTCGTKKYGADKIALLGLFTVALLTAHFIITSRSAVVLSEPMKLDYTGLSVSMPAGNGWQSETRWKYQKNAFILSSFFDSGAGSVTALARCRYLLAATKTAPDMLFEEKASAIGGVIAKAGQIRTGRAGYRFAEGLQNGVPLTIDWVHIKKPKILFDTFFGTVQLPNSRQLNIEVYQAMGDTNLAKQAFERIAEGLKFKDSQLLEAGSEIIAEIKSKGINSFLDTPVKEPQNWLPSGNQGREDFFLVRDAKRNTIGFTMDILIDSALEAQLNIQGVSLLYIRGRYAREQATFFQSRNNLDEFAWKSEVSSSAGKSSTEVVLDKAGVMTVRKYGVRTEEKNYQLSPAAIPDVFGELTFGQMLDSDHEKIFLDVISADGRILPTLVSRIEVKDPVVAEEDPILRFFIKTGIREEIAYVLRVEPLDGWGFFEQVYLDGQKRVLIRLLQQEGIYTVERTSVENILRQFPERADYILQKNKMLEQNQLWENSE